MGLLDKIKSDVKKSGSSKGKLFYVKDGTKCRIRFLDDMEDGLEIPFHDSFERGINVPCREVYGKSCPYCEDEDLRTRSQYIWNVYNYDAKEVQLFMYPVNSFSPIPALVAMHENYGTLTDRDYVISRTGKQTNTSYSVVPMDKVKFRNDKAKPYSKNQILKMIQKAYPEDTDEDEDDIEENTSGDTYSDMTAKELYKLCIERGIEVEKKKKEKYYINLLREYDEAQDDWDDEEDSQISEDDEWEDDDE